MADKQEPRVFRCRGCMKFVSENTAVEKLEHTSSGIENRIYCKRCATMRGIPFKGGPKTI